MKQMKDLFAKALPSSDSKSRSSAAVGSHDFPEVMWDIEPRHRSTAHSDSETVLENAHSRVVSGVWFLLRNECEELIRKAEKVGFKSVDWEYSKDYRDCERVVVKAPLLAEQLWKRLQGFMTPAEYLNVRPYGFDNEGFWAPHGLNDCIRFVKYKPGGHFQPHKDGAFVLDDDNRSCLTLQVYLSDEFEGGDTVFFDESESPPREVHVSPRTGNLLLFNHDVMHMGEVVTGGPQPKYILRADVMFRREFGDSASLSKGLLRNPDFLRMDALYKKSIRLQQAGDPRGSTEAYVEAQKIQTAFPSRSPVAQAAPSPTESDWPLGFDVSVYLFSFLSLKEVAKCALVCRTWKSIISDPSLWRKFYFQRWPRIAKAERLLGLSPSILNYSKPWRQAFIQRVEAENDFVAIFFDIGSETTRFGIAGPADTVKRDRDYYAYSHFPQDEPALDPPEIPSLVARVKGHYWSAREGLEDYLVGPQVVKSFYNSYRPFGPFEAAPVAAASGHGRTHLPLEFPKGNYGYRSMDTNPVFSVDGRAIIHWNAIRNLCKWILSAGFGSPQTLSPHPILFAVPSFFGLQEQRALDHLVRNQLSARAMSMVSASVLALLSVERKTGLVVSSGHLFTDITPVWDGGPLHAQAVPFPYAGAALQAYVANPEGEDLKREVGRFFFPQDPAKNLAHLAFNAVMACEEDKREELFKCVLLVGGNTFSFEEQFRKELAALAYPSPYKPTVVVPADRLTAISLGAKLYCSYSGVRGLFSEEWISQ